ncbi:ferrated catecholamine ABC transporter substrate-binding lipoprotein SstD [Staphylococcus agnetis]|uniref:ferrated catecholamine ABC transporter substrate-binding lipoprotein SstD n=1 Tax=Staphylococcus agnetis TaxID=985762 RepID=UPI001FB1F89C|nr:ABC transporter substrate-binding protein [Staphylococcus agnetis]UOC12887.1 ABC transporter substrate-binding protein [Staphylococcus agnetis]
MKKLGLLLMVAMVFVLVACGNDDNKSSKKGGSKETVEVKNDFKLRGKADDGSQDKAYSDTVEVPKNPQKAVVFDYGALKTLEEMGLKDKVAALPKGEGNAQLPDFLDDFKSDKYQNTGSLKEINFDVIAKVKPDVIYLSARTANQKNIDEVKKAAPDAPIVYMGAKNDDFIESMKNDTSILGKIYDTEKKAEALNKELDEKIAEVKAKTKNLDLKAMYLLVNEGELSTFGAGDRFGNLVFDTLGFKPVDDNIKKSSHGQNVTNEYVSEKNPDIIFAMDRGKAIGEKSTAKQVLGNNVIKNVKAVKNGKVLELDPKLWYFASGSTTTTIEQIEEIEEGLKLDK